MRPNNAPGCFGQGISSMRSATCQKCPAQKACAKAAIKSLQEVSEAIDVRDYLAIHNQQPVYNNPIIDRHHPVKKVALRKVNKEEAKMLFTLPTEAAKIVSRLLQKNLCLKTHLNNGSNPFRDVKPLFLASAFDLALRKSEFSHKELTYCYREIGGAKGTVRQRISIAVHVLQSMGVIKESGFKTYRVISNE